MIKPRGSSSARPSPRSRSTQPPQAASVSALSARTGFGVASKSGRKWGRRGSSSRSAPRFTMMWLPGSSCRWLSSTPSHDHTCTPVASARSRWNPSYCPSLPAPGTESGRKSPAASASSTRRPRVGRVDPSSGSPRRTPLSNAATAGSEFPDGAEPPDGAELPDGTVLTAIHVPPATRSRPPVTVGISGQCVAGGSQARCMNSSRTAASRIGQAAVG